MKSGVGVCALVVLATIGATSVQSDPQAVALLAKHRAYVGWQFGDGTFRTMRIEGNVTDEHGKQTETFVLTSAGLLYNDAYKQVKNGGVVQHDGFTGRVFWSSNINGFTTPIYGDYAKFLASYTLLQNEGTTELPATFIANKAVDGKTTGVVRVTLDNGDPIEIAVDPATGAYVTATIDPGGAYETTYHILSYADVVPGKKMISSFRAGDSRSVYSYTSFEPNPAVNADELHPPAATAYWTFANNAPLPLKVTDYRILVDATIDGVPGRFILDTGADAIYLDDRFADRVHAAALGGSSEVHTMYGAVPTRVRSAPSITFGGATLHNVLVFSQDFRHNDYRGLDLEGYDGLIGFDLFAGAIVKLDIYNSQMTIADPSQDVSGTAGLPLVVDLSQGIPTIPMTLNQSIPVNAMLDTGNPRIVAIGSDLIKQRHLHIYGCGRIDSLAVGPFTYQHQTACDEGFSANYILLGYDFLKHFDYVFDDPHGRMIMTPNKMPQGHYGVSP